MKLNSSLFAAAFLAAVANLGAAPLTESTLVFAKPDASTPSVATLKAGTEPTLTASAVPGVAGWTAVAIAGPHEVYAANKDIMKSLDVRPGSAYHTEAKADSPVLAIAEAGDKAEIIDYRGKWTKLRLTKVVVGYIKTPAKVSPGYNANIPNSTTIPSNHVASNATGSNVGSTGSGVSTGSASAAPTTPPSYAPGSASNAGRSQTTVPGAAADTTPPATFPGAGRAAPVGDGGSSALPRLFQGKFTSTYSALRPRRPYDFQLNDDSGSRYAYVDTSKLLATEQLNKYTDRTVVVYGTAKAVAGSKDMVIVAESLQLR